MMKRISFMGALVTDSVANANEEGTFMVNQGLIFVVNKDPGFVVNEPLMDVVNVLPTFMVKSRLKRRRAGARLHN
jgi:hypothetical protein